ncbi:MAG: O-antigen ligase family protein [Bryobacterales bacterium]|nr:O-antigen ligase family protein [Bryobacterales bacterium]
MKILALLLAAGIVTAWMPRPEPWWALQSALLALGAAWAWAGELRRVRPSPWLAVLALGALWPCVQILAGTTVHAEATRAASLQWSAWLAAYVVAEAAARRDEARRVWMLRACAAFAVAQALLAILQRFTAEGRVFWLFDSGYRTGQMGPWVYDNQYAGFVLMLMPLTLWRARGWTFAAPALLVASVFVSGSLAGSILVVTEALVVLALRGDAAVLRRFAAVAVLASAMLGVTGWEALNEKLRRDAPLQVRRQLTLATVEMARDRPWLGWGLGTWSTVYPAYARFDDGAFDNQAHNDWAQWAAEGGVPFFAVTLLLAAGAVAAGWRTGWAVGLAFVLVHCVIEYHFQQRPVFGAVYFTLAALARTEPHTAPPARQQR